MISDDQLQRIEQSLLHYAHEMHEYTLQLWTDSCRAAEERKASRGVKQRRASDLIHAKSRVVDYTPHVVAGSADATAAVANNNHNKTAVFTAAHAATSGSPSSDSD
jgi:hypothetical protein